MLLTLFPPNQFGSKSTLWKNTVDKIISDPLWSARDATDSSHILMVPLHFSFLTNDKAGIDAFENLFSRFSYRELKIGQLDQAQWMYLLSRYLSLKAEFEIEYTDADNNLLNRLMAWTHSRWHFLPAWQWGKRSFSGVKKRIEYVLSLQVPKLPSYYSAIIDYELFLFAIAADLKYISLNNNEFFSTEYISTLDEIRVCVMDVLRKKGSFTSQGWLFQKGVWADYRDYAYCGHAELSGELKPLKISTIAVDSSHSHRFPLWLRSFYLSQESDSDREEIKIIINAFSYQFKHHVAIRSTGYLKLNNYMDGNNGVYRYKYSTIGSNSKLGYGPYELSGVLGESWYPFLIDVDDVYHYYKLSFPLPIEAIDLYTGPNTTRKRNPLFKWPDFFSNGFAELISGQSYYLSKNYKLE